MDILANINSDDTPKISTFFDISSTYVNQIHIIKTPPPKTAGVFLCVHKQLAADK